MRQTTKCKKLLQEIKKKLSYLFLYPTENQVVEELINIHIHCKLKQNVARGVSRNS